MCYKREQEKYIHINTISTLLSQGLFTQHSFQLKSENVLCVLAVHLHDTSVLVA